MYDAIKIKHQHCDGLPIQTFEHLLSLGRESSQIHTSLLHCTWLHTEDGCSSMLSAA